MPHKDIMYFLIAMSKRHSKPRVKIALRKKAHCYCCACLCKWSYLDLSSIKCFSFGPLFCWFTSKDHFFQDFEHSRSQDRRNSLLIILAHQCQLSSSRLKKFQILWEQALLLRFKISGVASDNIGRNSFFDISQILLRTCMRLSWSL